MRAYTLEHFQLRPVDGWKPSDGLETTVWFAHAIHVDDDEIRKFAATGCAPPMSMLPTCAGPGIAPTRNTMAART